MESTDRGRAAKLLGIGLWVLIVLEVLGMGAAGANKFAGDAWPRMFEGWGYAAWFAYLIGASEVAGAILILVPRLASYAGTFLIAIMLGAIYTVTTTTYETALGPGVPSVHVAVLVIIVAARWNRRWRPGGGAATS